MGLLWSWKPWLLLGGLVVIGGPIMVAFLPRRCCGRTFPDSFAYARHRHTAHQDMP